MRSVWRKIKLQLRTAFLLWFILGFCLIFSLGSCRPERLVNTDTTAIANQPPSQAKVLRIGHQPHGAGLLLKVRGTLEKRLAPMGVSVEWIQFPAGPPIMAAMQEGKIDMGYAGIVPPLFAQANDVPFVYVANEPATPEAVGILVPKNSSIQTLSDLKGKRITATKASAGYYLLLQALLKSGLTLKDVEFVDLPPPQAQEAFKRGEVDAWVGWNPFLAQLQESMSVRLLTNAEGLMNDRNFYMTTRSFASNHYDLVKIAIAEIRTTGIWANNHPTDAAKILAASTKLNLTAALQDIKSRRFGAQPIQDRAIEDQQRIAETFFRLGLLPKRIWVEDAVWKLGLNN